MLEVRGRQWVTRPVRCHPRRPSGGARRAVTLVVILAVAFLQGSVRWYRRACRSGFCRDRDLGGAGHRRARRLHAPRRAAGHRGAGVARRVAAGAAGHGGGGGCHRRHRGAPWPSQPRRPGADHCCRGGRQRHRAPANFATENTVKELPEAARALIDGPHYAHIATRMPDGGGRTGSRCGSAGRRPDRPFTGTGLL
jgi:hypothetical protein